MNKNTRSGLSYNTDQPPAKKVRIAEKFEAQTQLDDTLAQLKDDIHWLHIERSKLRSECNRLDKDCARIRDERNTLRVKCVKLQTENVKLKSENVKLKSENMKLKSDETLMSGVVSELIESESKLQSAQNKLQDSKRIFTKLLRFSISFIGGIGNVKTLRERASASLTNLGADGFFDRTRQTTNPNVIEMAKTVLCTNCHSGKHACALGVVIAKYCEYCLNSTIKPIIPILGYEVAREILNERIEKMGRYYHGNNLLSNRLAN